MEKNLGQLRKAIKKDGIPSDFNKLKKVSGSILNLTEGHGEISRRNYSLG